VTGEPPLATGRDADVFAFGPDRVRRRYRDGGDTGPEAAAMRYAAGYGYPVPAVFAAEGPDLVMARVAGPTMLAALLEGTMDGAAAGAELADLLRRLHAIPPRPGAGPGERLLHLDLHPANVMLGPSGSVVIDWRNARDGPPDLDLAVTALIVAQVVVTAEMVAELSTDADRVTGQARRMLPELLARAAANGADPVSRVDDAVAFRRATPNTTAAEAAQLDVAAALVAALAQPSSTGTSTRLPYSVQEPS
jgi:aminoglycoside phosphotransferase (APT) family kinase protein